MLARWVTEVQDEADQVEETQELAETETAKAVFVIGSPTTGTLEAILVHEGQPIEPNERPAAITARDAATQSKRSAPAQSELVQPQTSRPPTGYMRYGLRVRLLSQCWKSGPKGVGIKGVVGGSGNLRLVPLPGMGGPADHDEPPARPAGPVFCR